MSRSILWSVACTLIALLPASAALAQSNDYIRGTVVSVDIEDGQGSITVDLRDSGERETYTVTPGTEIDFDTNAGTRFGLTERDDMASLRRGDTVRLLVEDDGAGNLSVARYQREAEASGNMEPARSNDTGVATTSRRDDADQQPAYSSLPDTATQLPLLAALGFGALLLGGGLHAARKLRVLA